MNNTDILTDYNKAIIDIVRNVMGEDKKEQINDDIESILEVVTNDKEFRDEFLVLSDLENYGFGPFGYGIYVEIAKNHPEFKDQAKEEFVQKIEFRNSDDWLQTGMFYAEDVQNVQECVEYYKGVCNKWQEYADYFGVKPDFESFNHAIARYMDVATDLYLPRDEQLIAELPTEVFNDICNIREYSSEIEL